MLYDTLRKYFYPIVFYVLVIFSAICLRFDEDEDSFVRALTACSMCTAKEGLWFFIENAVPFFFWNSALCEVCISGLFVLRDALIIVYYTAPVVLCGAVYEMYRRASFLRRLIGNNRTAMDNFMATVNATIAQIQNTEQTNVTALNALITNRTDVLNHRHAHVQQQIVDGVARLMDLEGEVRTVDHRVRSTRDRLGDLRREVHRETGSLRGDVASLASDVAWDFDIVEGLARRTAEQVDSLEDRVINEARHVDTIHGLVRANEQENRGNRHQMNFTLRLVVGARNRLRLLERDHLDESGRLQHMITTDHVRVIAMGGRVNDIQGELSSHADQLGDLRGLTDRTRTRLDNLQRDFEVFVADQDNQEEIRALPGSAAEGEAISALPGSAAELNRQRTERRAVSRVGRENSPRAAARRTSAPPGNSANSLAVDVVVPSALSPNAVTIIVLQIKELLENGNPENATVFRSPFDFAIMNPRVSLYNDMWRPTEILRIIATPQDPVFQGEQSHGEDVPPMIFAVVDSRRVDGYLNRTCQMCFCNIHRESHLISPWCCGHGLHLDCFVRFHRQNHQEHCPLCGYVMMGRRNNNNVVFVVPRNLTGSAMANDQDSSAVAAGGDPEPPSVPPPPPALPAGAGISPALPSQAPNVDVSSAAISRSIMNLIFDAQPENGMVLRFAQEYRAMIPDVRFSAHNYWTLNAVEKVVVAEPDPVFRDNSNAAQSNSRMVLAVLNFTPSERIISWDCQMCAQPITNSQIAMMPWDCPHGLHGNCFVRNHRQNPQGRCRLCPFMLGSWGSRNHENLVYVAALEDPRIDVERAMGDSAVPIDDTPPLLVPDVAMSAPPSAQPASESVSGSRQSQRLRRPPRASGILTADNEIAVTIDAMVRGPRPVNGMRTLRTAQDYERYIPHVPCSHRLFTGINIDRTVLTREDPVFQDRQWRGQDIPPLVITVVSPFLPTIARHHHFTCQVCEGPITNAHVMIMPWGRDCSHAVHTACFTTIHGLNPFSPCRRCPPNVESARMPHNLVFAAERGNFTTGRQMRPTVRDQVDPFAPPSSVGVDAVEPVVGAGAVVVEPVVDAGPVVVPAAPPRINLRTARNRVDGPVYHYTNHVTGEAVDYDEFHNAGTPNGRYHMQYNDLVPVPPNPPCTICGRDFGQGFDNVLQRWECPHPVHEECYGNFGGKLDPCRVCHAATLPGSSVIKSYRSIRTFDNMPLPTPAEGDTMDNVLGLCVMCQEKMEPTDPLVRPWLCAGQYPHWVHTTCWTGQVKQFGLGTKNRCVQCRARLPAHQEFHNVVHGVNNYAAADQAAADQAAAAAAAVAMDGN